MKRYYLTERPPMPGAIPGGGKVTNVEDFGWKVLCDIGNGCSIMAWGYIETKKPLTEEEITQYELVETDI